MHTVKDHPQNDQKFKICFFSFPFYFFKCFAARLVSVWGAFEGSFYFRLVECSGAVREIVVGFGY